MNKKLLVQWNTLSPVIKLCIVAGLFLLLYVSAEKWVESVKRSAQSHKVIGSSSASGQSRAVSVSTKTYYLAADFEKSNPLSKDLDESLFVEAEPVVAVPQTKVIKKPEIKLKEQPVFAKTPLTYFVQNSLKADGVEDDGAFINGAYYLWKEQVATKVFTPNGSFTPTLIKSSSDNNVIVSIDGQWFSLKVSP